MATKTTGLGHRRQRTRPRQAASARTLDRLELDVALIIYDAQEGQPRHVTIRRLRKLLATIRKAEKR